jgi:hypothetical protein
MNRNLQLTNIQLEAFKLFQRKNADYGDAFANHGPIGVLVRLGDKIQRLQHITNKSVTLVNNESLRDTLIDLHNYAAMAIMLLDEQKLTTSPIKKSNSHKTLKKKIIKHNTSYASFYDLYRESYEKELNELSFNSDYGQFVDISPNSSIE